MKLTPIVEHEGEIKCVDNRVISFGSSFYYHGIPR